MRGAKVTVYLLVLSLFIFGSLAAAQEGGDSQRGAELYQTYCLMCHGADGQGRVGANLQAFPGIAIQAAFQQTIANGVDGSVMPAFGSDQGGPLSDVDIADISAYLSGVLDGTEPIAPAPVYVAPEIAPLPDIQGDPSNGAVVFNANCVACHGDKAQGGFGWPLAKNWPGNQPEVFISQVVERGIDGTVMPGWGEESGGPLSSVEIEDLTSYILSLEPASSLPEPTDLPPGPLGRNASLMIFGAVALIAAVVLFLYYRKK